MFCKGAAQNTNNTFIDEIWYGFLIQVFAVLVMPGLWLALAER